MGDILPDITFDHDGWYLKKIEVRENYAATFIIKRVFAPQRFWHLYHQPHGLSSNSLEKRGRRFLAPRYHFQNK